MNAPNPLGPFVGAPHVRQAMLATLRRWGPFYVAEAARQAQVLPRTPLVDSYGQVVERPDEPLPQFADFVNEPMISTDNAGSKPRYVVAVPRTLDTHRKGDGNYIASWDVQLAVWMWGGNYQDTQDRLGFYVVALRQLVLQHPDLGGLAQTTTWRGEQYTELASTTLRTWGQAVLQFTVEIDGVVNAFAGPAVPPDDPTVAPLPAVDWVSTDIRVQPLAE